MNRKYSEIIKKNDAKIANIKPRIPILDGVAPSLISFLDKKTIGLSKFFLILFNISIFHLNDIIL